MRLVRRTLHVLSWVGTLCVIAVALALIASQTPWFRDWLRRAIVRETRQYIDGELTIGRLGGNLFFGVTLGDVAVDVSGDRVVAVKAVEVDYSIFQLFSQGINIDRLALTAPSVHLVRDARGWNLRRLVKRQRKEADREGPGRPVTLTSITIADASLTIDDRIGSPAYRLPRRIDDLDVQTSFAYEPVHFSIGLEQLNLRASEPALTLHQLKGNIAVRDDNLYLERMVVRTGESAVDIDGLIERYLQMPAIRVTTSGLVSLPEIGGVLPAVEGFGLHPRLAATLNGTTDRLAMDLDVKSEAGLLRGQIVADFRAPDLRFTGPVHVERLNVGPLLKNPAQRSDITGDAKVDVAILSAPAGAPALDRLAGTFAFHGPRAAALGYEAAQVSAAGSLKGRRVTLASARARAYGAAASTSGWIELPSGRQAVAYDLKGTAANVDMRRLPRPVRAPLLETDLSLASYEVRGRGSAVEASAVLRQSTVEGATVGEGTVARFEAGNGPVSYAARGHVSDLHLPRLGRALRVATLDDPRYEGSVTGDFDVTGSGTALKEMTLDATGTLTDSSAVGTHLSELAFSARIADAGLTVYAKGGFDQLNPAVLSRREALVGNVNGRVDGTFRMPDMTAPVTAAAFGFEGQVALDPSLVGGVQIAGASVKGRYAAEVADLEALQIKGPDVELDASGRLALDRSSASNLTYHVDARDISEVGEIAGQKGLEGSVVLDGTVTGNRSALQIDGKLSGSALAFNDTRALEASSTYAVTIPELDAASLKAQATTDATFVEVAGTKLNAVTAKTTYLRKQLDFSTRIQERTRELEATGKLVFHPDHQEIHLPQLAIRTQGIEWRTVPGGDPAIQYGKDRLDIRDIRLAKDDQNLEVNGSLSLGTGKPTGSVAVKAVNVDLSEIERLLLQNRGFHGRLTADATIAGSTNAPQVDGHFEVRNGAFQNYTYELLTADVDYGGSRITLDATLRQAADVTITAKGVVPTSLFQRAKGGHVAASADDAIDLRIQTPLLNLGLAQGFTTEISNVSGTLQADVHITGSGLDPHLQGFVEIRDGAFAVPRGGTVYSGLDTRIDLEEDLVRIRRFEILDENGEQLAVSGQLAVHARQVGAVDVQLESENFEIIDNELGDVGVGTRLKVTGELSRPKLEGDVRITAGRLEVDRILALFYDPYRVESLPDVVSAERQAQAAGSAREATERALAQAGQGVAAPEGKPVETEDKPAPTAAGAFENVALDVRVRIPDNLVLRGRKIRAGGPTSAALGDINLTVGGDLEVRKEAGGAVRLYGTVNTVRGTYQFQGRRFDLARNGTLRFAGESRIDPVLDVTAIRRIPDTGVEARVRITGTISHPELQLSSTPPLEESDVLALIVFNRSTNELGSGERAALAATAGGIATGFLATPLGESIGRALDLDLFEITTSSEGDTIGAGVIVGEQIGERTFLKLRQQFGERPYSEFLLEYQIADFLRVEGSAAPETSGSANRIGQRRIERAGINLIFFFSY
jgi:translocation and assembly module TamB